MTSILSILNKVQYSQVGCHFRGIHASGLKSEFKKCVHHNGGHLGVKSGGQSDLHFDNFDVRRNIVK